MRRTDSTRAVLDLLPECTHLRTLEFRFVELELTGETVQAGNVLGPHPLVVNWRFSLGNTLHV